MALKEDNYHGSGESFEFIETPKAATPKLDIVENCGVRTTSVSWTHSASETN
jgi:hypothetical protein